jgi:tRNA (adenine22-N1)-methyltransferase
LKQKQSVNYAIQPEPNASVITAILKDMNRRLRTILSLIPHDHPVADIGADHGLVPLALLRAGFNRALYATELTEASFARLKLAVMDTEIRPYQANGLTSLPQEVKTIICTGMGGHLMIAILEQFPATTKRLKTLILGPQRDAERVRGWLSTHGWMIVEEGFVFEDGNAYPIIKAEPGNQPLTDPARWYGPWMIDHPNLDFLLFLSQEANILRQALQFKVDEDKRLRLEWIQQYVKHHDLA